MKNGSLEDTRNDKRPSVCTLHLQRQLRLSPQTKDRMMRPCCQKLVHCQSSRRRISAGFVPHVVSFTRNLASSPSPTNPGRRQRFYVHVDVAPCPPPWQKQTKQQQSFDASSMVASPVSAGVDGTNSASGVALVTPNDNDDGHTQKSRLVPRLPPRRLLHSKSTKIQHNGEISNDGQNHNDDHDDENLPNQHVSWYTVTLDGRSLRTPLGQPLCLPSEGLAHAIAVEWNAVSSAIVPLQMPLMTLACTTLDQVVSSSSSVQTYRTHCLQYLHTDTVGYWADPVEDRVLYGRQQSAWKDLYTWIVNEFAAGLPPPGQVTGMDHGALFGRRFNTTDTTTPSERRNDPATASSTGETKYTGRGLAHDDRVIEAAHAWVESLDAWHTTCLYVACAEAKSFWIAASLMMNSTSTTATTTTTMDAKQAQIAARVEEEFNIEAWGLVEGQHDYDRLNSAVQLQAVSLMTHFLADACGQQNTRVESSG